MYKLIEREYTSVFGNRPLLSPVIGYGYEFSRLFDAKLFMVSEAKRFIFTQCFNNGCSSENLEYKVELNEKKNGITVRTRNKYQKWYEVREYEIIHE